MALTQANMRTLWLLLIQVVILIVCLVYIQKIYYQNILPDKKAIKEFESSTCTVVNKVLENKGTFLKRYRARFEITYHVDQLPYKNITYGNGLDNTFTTDRNSQETLLNEFNLGENYPCWINPKFPQQAILVLRNNWESIFTLFIPSVLFLIVSYSFLRTLFKFLRRRV